MPNNWSTGNDDKNYRQAGHVVFYSILAIDTGLYFYYDKVFIYFIVINFKSKNVKHITSLEWKTCRTKKKFKITFRS